MRQNNINSWYYINSLWNKCIIDRIYCANSRINLNKAGASSMEQKCHRQYCMNILVSVYLSSNWQERLAIDKAGSWSMEQKRYRKFFIYFSNHDTSNIPNLSNPNVNLSLASQTKCNNMFSDPKSDHIFPHFLGTYLVYIFFFSYVEIIHLLRRG